MDIYVQPSRQEGLPRAMIEAMSRGLPCIGAATGGIPELISAERIFRPGKLAQIVETVAEVCDTSTLADEARANFECAAQYSNTNLNARRTAFYEMFLEEYFG